MENFCLVTQFKGITNNPNLPNFGKMVITFHGDSDALMWRFGGGTYKILEGKFYTSNTYATEWPSEGDLPNTGNYAFYLKANETAKIEIDKYDIYYCGSGTGNHGTVELDFKEFYVSEVLDTINLQAASRNNYIKGSLEALVETMCQYRNSGTLTFNIYLTKVTFNGNEPNYGNAQGTITFGENSVSVANSGSTVLGTYNKLTKTWSYS